MQLRGKDCFTVAWAPNTESRTPKSVLQFRSQSYTTRVLSIRNPQPAIRNQLVPSFGNPAPGIANQVFEARMGAQVEHDKLGIQVVDLFGLE